MSPTVQIVTVSLLAAALLALAGWTLTLQLRLRRLTREYTTLMTGVDGADLQETLNQHLAQVHQALRTVSELEERTLSLELTQPLCLQWVGAIRFNPFRDTGGAQSFALAIADARGDGIVLSSLHARHNTRVYAKPLHAWQSEYTLTDEEEQAIERAQREQSMHAAQPRIATQP